MFEKALENIFLQLEGMSYSDIDRIITAIKYKMVDYCNFSMSNIISESEPTTSTQFLSN